MNHVVIASSIRLRMIPSSQSNYGERDSLSSGNTLRAVDVLSTALAFGRPPVGMSSATTPIHDSICGTVGTGEGDSAESEVLGALCAGLAVQTTGRGPVHQRT